MENMMHIIPIIVFFGLAHGILLMAGLKPSKPDNDGIFLVASVITAIGLVYSSYAYSGYRGAGLSVLLLLSAWSWAAVFAKKI
jgi:ABC-type arginine transport system permease subunit